MIYTATGTDAIQLQLITSSGAGEATLTLGPIKSSISCLEKVSYIDGVYDSSGNKNPRGPVFIYDSYKPIIKNNFRSITTSSSAEITLQLKTKRHEITSP